MNNTDKSNEFPPKNVISIFNHQHLQPQSMDNTLKEYRRSVNKYLFFPDLNKFYSNIQKEEYSLNYLIENSKLLNKSNDIEIQFKQSKISSSCQKSQLARKRSKNHFNTDHRNELNLTSFLNRFSKHNPQTKLLGCKRKNKHKKLINVKNIENPPLGFYNTNSFENFKYQKTRSPVFFPQQKNKSKQNSSDPIILKQFYKEHITENHQNLRIHPKKKDILDLIPTLLKKQKSLKYIDTFQEGHKRFQLLFNNIKKKYHH